MKLFFSFLLVLAGALELRGGSGPAYTIQTVAGSAQSGDGGWAVAAQLGAIQGVAADRQGNLYLSDTDNHRVRKVDIYGTISTIAGTGTGGFSGDGGPATAAQLRLPYGLAVDAGGALYIADLGNDRVRRVSPEGRITTVAGTGVKGSQGDGGPGLNAQLFTPRNLAVDAAGNLYIAEFEGHRVRKVTPDGRIATVAGTGVAGFRGDGGPATAAQLSFPAGLAVDRTGTLYIADSGNQRIRKILPNNLISTVLGGNSGSALATPIALAIDNALTLYVADSSYVVRSYTAANVWATAAGTGTAGFAGDGGPAAAAQVTAAHDLGVDVTGNLFIADGTRVRKVNLKAAISTVAGDGYLHAIGDGGAATQGLLLQPAAIALDAVGNLFIADTGTQRVRTVAADGMLQTLAGTGVGGYNADQAGGLSQLNGPMGVAADRAGNVYIADTNNHRVRSVRDQRVQTYAGTGTAGTGQEMLPGPQTQLRAPRGICTDLMGMVYIVDTANHRVLRAPPGALVETAAGNGSPGAAGDGGPGRAAQLNQPCACAADAAGNLFIADTMNHRIRKVSAGGTISTVAGTGSAGFGGDGGAATAAALSGPRGLAVDGDGDLFIADSGNQRIRVVTPDGTIYTIAGTGAAGFAGDGGAASLAQLQTPSGMVLDGSGNLYVADSGNNRVRRLVRQAEVVEPPPLQLAPALSVVNAASLAPGAVAPGEIVTIYGTGLGPESGVAAGFDASGLLMNLLAGSEVRVDGVPVPLYYVQANQINAQVPYTVAGTGSAHIETRYQGKVTGGADLKVAETALGLYPGVVNPDGSLNGEIAPAARGTVVTIYATGEGMTTGSNIAGQPATAPYGRPVLPVQLRIGGVAAQMLYAGSAPGLCGLLQINATVPAGLAAAGPVAVELTLGSAQAASITMWVQ